MSGLPAGKKSLPKILADSDDAHRVIDLVILLDYLLSTLGSENGSASTRERVDRNATLFSNKGDVHFGITVRNRLAHTDQGEKAPTEEEVVRAREHLVRAVRDLERHLAPDLRNAVAGASGGRFARLKPALAPVCLFFGAWQLFAVLAGLVVEQLGGLKGSRWFVLLVGLVLLNQIVIPQAARWIRGVTSVLRGSLVSYLLGLALAIRGIVLWSSGATQSELVDGYCGWFGGVGDALESFLGQGVWAAAPWLVLSREETWSEITRQDALSVAVYLAPVLVMLAALLWSFRPARLSGKAAAASAGDARAAIWAAYALGVFLVAERAYSALS